MAFTPFEVNVPHLCYTFLGGFVVLFGMFSLVIKERLYIGEAVIATVFGIVIGPHGANLFSPINWGGEGSEITNEITLEVTRVVIAIGVFAVGVELPKAYMKKKWRSLAFLLGPVMVFGWLISALIIWGLFPKMDYLCALVIAACVTPTDPILAQAVVGGKFADKHVPAHIRHLLSAESGSNDGAAFPFLYLALYLILDTAGTGHAIGKWFYVTWLYEIILGTILGALLGFAARKTMKFCERHGLIDRQSFVAQYVSLAVLSIGMTALLGSDDLLAAFACGCAFAWDGFFNKATEDSFFSNVIDLLFNCAAFIYIGAIIPFSQFVDGNLGMSIWRLILLSLSILVLRRLPVIMALYTWIPDIRTSREALFVGWFGPMGVGAIFISTLARTKLPEPEYPPHTAVEYMTSTIQPMVAFLVLSSVMFHGLSIPFFSLGRRVHSISRTMSRSSMELHHEPAWSTHSRRITRGANIRINRDDDEEVDDPAADRGAVENEKPLDGWGVDSSRTPSGSGESSTQMEEGGEVRTTRRSDADAMERGEYPADKDITEERRDSRNDGECTPPLAQYREGKHLIVERRKGDGDEVSVEVKRNYFNDDEETELKSFDHPTRLKHGELEKLRARIDTSIHHAISAVRGGGIDEIDRLGMGLMDGRAAEEADAEEQQKIADGEAREREIIKGEVERGERDPSYPEENDEEDSAEQQAQDREAGRRARLAAKANAANRKISEEPATMTRSEASAVRAASQEELSEQDRSPSFGRRTSKTSSTKPTVQSRRPASTRKESVRRLLFGKKSAVGKAQGFSVSAPMNPRPLDGPASDEEEEPAPPQRGRSAPIPSSASPVLATTSEIKTVSRPGSRPPSPPRLAPAIRFTPETAVSSSTVPSGLRGYGHKPSGSGLDLHRTVSIQSMASQADRGSRPPSPTRAPAIRFTSETAESSATVPSGLRGYGHKPKNPSLTISRTQSAQGDSPAIRFTPDTAESSPTVPSGLRGYGHKPKNPSLSISRTQSAQGDSPAIRFTPDTAESSPTVPSGLRGYGHKPKNPSLSISRTQSVQSEAGRR